MTILTLEQPVALATVEERWTAEKANAWHASLPWLVGCNFIPSTAINQLEMWQETTFDPETIARELGWARDLGMNTVRVYLHDLLWLHDAAGFKQRIDRYLSIASSIGIRTLFTIFDDCWNNNPALGDQPAPMQGVHNSGWVQSPGERVVLDPSKWGRLETYVKDIVGSFGKDPRVLFWDLYNEPGNRNLGARSLPLVKKVFEWARAAQPEQPLSCGVWYLNDELNSYQLGASDVITFHCYEQPEVLKQVITYLKTLGRPLICTEYMARTRGSLFQTTLPIFKENNVGCYNWGLVAGKTNTIYQWDVPYDGGEPKLWFHDIFRADGTPYKPEEVEFIRATTGAKPA
jgi:hypothetical protein